MTVSGVNAFVGASAPDYKKPPEYLLATVKQDLNAVELTPEKGQQVIQNRLAEAVARTKLTLSVPIRDRLFPPVIWPVLESGRIQTWWAIFDATAADMLATCQQR